MSIREYDVGARNIHHDPSLRTTHIDVPTADSNPIKATGDAGPREDMYGQTEFHMSPSTHFDYSMEPSESEEPEITSMEIMDIQFYGESSMKRQQECDPKVSQTSTSFDVDTEPTEFEYSMKGSGNRSEPSEGKKNKIDTAGGECKEHLNHVGNYPESEKSLQDKIIEYGLSKGMKFPAIKKLIEAWLGDRDDDEDDEDRYPTVGDNVSYEGIEGLVIGIDKKNSDPDEAGGTMLIVKLKNGKTVRDWENQFMLESTKDFISYNRIIQEGLDLGLSNRDILSVMEAIEIPLDESGKKKWIQKAVNKMERKGSEGSLTKAAHKEDESPMEFAKEHKHSKGKVGKKARFALNVNKK